MNTHDIATLNLQDIPSISKKMKYYDGELFFGDNITSLPYIANVFRVNFLVVLFCLNGEMKMRINEQEVVVKQNDALFVNSRSLVAIDYTSPDVSCKLVAINSRMAFSLINKSLIDAVMMLQSNPVIPLSADEITLLDKYYELADFKMTHPAFNADRETMLEILKALSIDLLSFISRPEEGTSGILRQGDKLYRRFLYLVTDNVDGHRSVKSYADELCVSPKYLTSVCRQHSNRSASEIITQSLVARIKQMLLYSNMSVKEIASELNFDNLSFFGKFVKKHLGHSPVNYRKLHNYGV